MEAELAAKTTQNLIESLGFPVAMVVVLLGAMLLVARALKGWIEKKDIEAIAREQGLSAEIKQVREQQVAAFTGALSQNTTAMNRMAEAADRMMESDESTRTVLINVDQTMKLNQQTMEQVRRDLLGSSDRRRAVT